MASEAWPKTKNAEVVSRVEAEELFRLDNQELEGRSREEQADPYGAYSLPASLARLTYTRNVILSLAQTKWGSPGGLREEKLINIAAQPGTSGGGASSAAIASASASAADGTTDAIDSRARSLSEKLCAPSSNPTSMASSASLGSARGGLRLGLGPCTSLPSSGAGTSEETSNAGGARPLDDARPLAGALAQAGALAGRNFASFGGKAAHERKVARTAAAASAAGIKERSSLERATQTVNAALAGNLLVLCGKVVGMLLTGSGALFAEVLHSMADCANQALLAVGIRRSQMAPSQVHPYGHASELYVWAIISATGAFCLGSGVSLYHGVSSLLAPTAVTQSDLALAIMAGSFLVEATTLGIALRSISEGAKQAGTSLRQYIQSAADPMSVSVLIEDGASVAGIVIATSALLMTERTGDPMFDAVGTIAVGTLLAFAAMWLIKQNMKVLVGKSMARDKETAIIAMLRADPVVKSIQDVKTISFGSSNARFKVQKPNTNRNRNFIYIDSTPQCPTPQCPTPQCPTPQSSNEIYQSI